MEVFLLRHGIAQDPHLVASDEERRLTAEGRRKVEQVAEAFRKRVKALDGILHSPYLRAAETAEIFSREYPNTRLEEVSGITPYDHPEDAITLLQARPKAERLLLVGHEPNLSGVASLLLTGQENPILEFKKAGLAGLEWTPAGGGKLLFLLMPKFL